MRRFPDKARVVTYKKYITALQGVQPFPFRSPINFSAPLGLEKFRFEGNKNETGISFENSMFSTCFLSYMFLIGHAVTDLNEVKIFTS